MISIKPSIVTPPEVTANTEKKRIPLVWIPATLGVGLLIAAIYLGGRIVTAHPHPKAEVAPLATPSKPPVVNSAVKDATPPTQSEATPPPDATATPETTARDTEPPALPQKFVGPEAPASMTPEDAVPLITPQAGERYIQVGALNLPAVRRLVQRLRDKNLEPHVAPGPTPELMRVLIGPFDDHDKLEEEKKQLETAGVDTFIRKY